MKTKIILLCLLLYSVSGCAALQENAPAIEQTGEAVTESAAVISTFNPAIGVWVLVIGGLLIAIGKSFKNK